MTFTKDVFTPFYVYGMYSAPSEIKPDYPVLEIYSNDKRINYHDYSLHQWNRVLMAYDYAANVQKTDQFFEKNVQHVLGKLRLTPSRNYFVVDSSAHEKHKHLNAWKEMAEKVLEKKIDSFRVVHYSWNGAILKQQQ